MVAALSDLLESAGSVGGVTPPQCVGEGPGEGLIGVIINLYLSFIYRKREW